MSNNEGKKLMWLAAAGAVALTAVFQLIGAPLITAAAPAGILSYEFAGTLANAQAILASWDAQAQLFAAFSLGLDFLYPPVYAAAIGLSLATAVAHLPKPLQNPARGLVRLLWLAIALDYVENVALTQLLFGASSPFWPPLAWGCAALKFAIVLPGLALALIGGALALVAKAALGKSAQR